MIRVTFFFFLVVLISCKPDMKNFTKEEFQAAIRSKLAKQDTAAAIALLGQCVEKFPDEISAQIALIQLQVMTGKLSEEEGSTQIRNIDYTKSSGFEADHMMVYSKIDSIPPDSAILKVTSLIQKYPEYFYNYFMMGKKLIDAKRYPEAIEYFDKTIQMKPEFRYAYANRALALYLMGEKEAACEIWKTSMGGGAMYREKYCN